MASLYRLEVPHLQPGQQAHPLPQRLLEVELAGHRRCSHGGHLGAAPTARRQEIDHLPLDECRVGVHHDEVLGPAVQARRLDRQIDLAARRLLGQGAAERVHVRARHRQLVAVHGIGGQPHDALNVAAAARHAARHTTERGRIHLGSEQRDQVLLVRRARLGFSERFDRDAGAGPAQFLAHRCPDRGHPSRWQLRLDAEQQVTVHPDLLDVVHIDVAAGERVEQTFRDARGVLTAHRHQVRRP